MSNRKPPVKLSPRTLTWDFATNSRKYWFDGSPAISHFLNVYTLLVPDNERYYIRALVPCLKVLEDPEHRTELMQFFRQESMHGVAHQKYWKEMEAQGCKVQPFVHAVDVLLYKIMEPLQPHRLKMSIVAAIEHVNAVWGHIFLSRNLLEPADPVLRELFSWHFAEEIEHKAVAHRALGAMYPGYFTRALGALVAFPLFYLILLIGTIYLLAGDGELFKRRTMRDLAKLWFKQGFLKDSLYHMLRYFRPGFEPWELDDLTLSMSTIQGLSVSPRKVPLVASAAA